MEKNERWGGKSSGKITDTKFRETSFEENRYFLWLNDHIETICFETLESVFNQPEEETNNRVDENVVKMVSENFGLGVNDCVFENLESESYKKTNMVGDKVAKRVSENVVLGVNDDIFENLESESYNKTNMVDENVAKRVSGNFGLGVNDGVFENLESESYKKTNMVDENVAKRVSENVVLGGNDCVFENLESESYKKSIRVDDNVAKRVSNDVVFCSNYGEFENLESESYKKSIRVDDNVAKRVSNDVFFGSNYGEFENLESESYKKSIRVDDNVAKRVSNDVVFGLNYGEFENLESESYRKSIRVDDNVAKRVSNDVVFGSNYGEFENVERESYKDVSLGSNEPVVCKISDEEANKGVKVAETTTKKVVENVAKKQENVGEFGDLVNETEIESNRSKNLSFEANEGVLVEPLESEVGAVAEEEGEKAVAKKKIKVVRKVIRKVLKKVKKDEINGEFGELGVTSEVKIKNPMNISLGSDEILKPNCESDIGGDMAKEGEKAALGKTVRVIKRVVRKVPKRVWKEMNDGELGAGNEGEIGSSKFAVMGSNESRTLDSDSLNSSATNDAKKVVSKGSEKVQKEENGGGFRELGVGNEAKIDGPNHIDGVHTDETIKDQKRLKKEEGDVELKKFGVDNEAEMQNPMHIVSYLDEYPTPNSDIVKGVSSLENEMDVDEVEAEGSERMDGVKSSNVSYVEKDAVMVDDMALDEEMEAVMRRKRHRTEIFVGGLGKDAVEEDVRKAFKEVGEIVELTVKMHERNGKNKGFAFIRYASAADAEKAVEKSGKIEVLGKRCSVESLKGNDTIFLGKIDRTWKNADIVKLLQDVGVEKIDKVTIKSDAENPGCNLGYAFLKLETIRYAQKVFSVLEKKGRLGNRMITVEWAKPLSETVKEDMNKVKTVYAEYLPVSWDEETVKNHFKKYGEIENVVLARNLVSPIRKDFAFINYKTREAALTCIKAFTPELLHNEGSKVHVKVSLAKSTPKAKHASNPVIKISSHGKPKAAQTVIHPIRRRSEDKISSHYYDNRRFVMPPIKRETTSLHYDSSQVRASTDDELIQLLREQASWRQPETSLGVGSDSLEYTHSFPARKRQYIYPEDKPIFSNPRGYPCLRTESAFPALNASRLSPGQGMQPRYSLSNQFGVPSKIEGYLNLSQTRGGASSGGGSDVNRRY